MLTTTFRAMDTDIDVAVVEPCDRVAAQKAFGTVAELFRRYECTLTRFSEQSELSALNRSAGRPFAASPLLFEVVSAALNAADSTDGVFDPTILDALVSAGYDRTFSLLPVTRQDPGSGTVQASGRAYHEIRLDPMTRTIVLPKGVHLDLGGIAKGMAVDTSAKLLHPFRNFFVNAGGDLYAGGTAGDGLWLIGVQDPFVPDRDLALLSVTNAGVATSSVMRRRWNLGDGDARAGRHHIIDPRTGTSAGTDLAAVTVVACNATTADVVAKVALIRGRVEGRAVIEARGAGGLLIGLDGAIEATVGLSWAQLSLHARPNDESSKPGR
jgi:FAD:protein FMN transferase